MVKKKPDGSDPGWMTHTAARRAKLLPENRELSPWTGRVTTRLRGLSKQLSTPNFLFELIDIYFLEDCEKQGVIHVEEYIPDDCFSVDVRQDLRFQLAGGQISMNTGSRIYNYKQERCLAGLEHFHHNGWSSRDTDFDCFLEGIDLPGLKRKKARRGKAPCLMVKQQETAGNAVTLPDMSIFLLCIVYSMSRAELFANDVYSVESLSGVTEEVSSVPGGLHVFRKDMTQKDIKAIFRVDSSAE